MIREFAAIDVYYLLLAARWTIALTALAFVGGGLFGIVVALMRVSPFLPLRALGMLIPWCQTQSSQAGGGDRQRALARIEQAAADLMERELSDASLTAGMVPVPLRAAVAAQLQAVLTAAATIAT